MVIFSIVRTDLTLHDVKAVGCVTVFFKGLGFWYTVHIISYIPPILYDQHISVSALKLAGIRTIEFLLVEL